MSDVIDKKEKLLVEFLLADPHVFTKAHSILKPSYFDPPLDSVVKWVLSYFDKHHGVPAVSVIEAETEVKLKEREIDESETSYLLDEIQSFCSQQAMTEAVLDGIDIINSGGDITKVQSLVRDALLVKMDTTLGVSTFDNPFDRLMAYEENRVPYVLGIPALDAMNGSAWYRGELYLFAAATSTGKSVMLANIASRLAHIQLDAHIVSVEMDENPYARRIDSIITGLPMKGVEVEKLADALNDKKDQYARITTKRVNARFGIDDLRAHLMEYHVQYGKYPDVFILDYLDIFANGRNPGMSKFDWDEMKSHELRDLLVEFDMLGFSACQLNRDSYTDLISVSPAHIAGGLSKVNASDATIAMVVNDEDIDNNQLQCKGIKVRGASKSSSMVTLYRCPRTLRISDQPFNQAPKKTSSLTDRKKQTPAKNDKIKDAMNITKRR